MLIKLYPNQISDKWDAIGSTIEKALPPMIVNDPESMNNIFLALLEEKLLCWVYIKEEKIGAIITTQVIEDIASKQRSLLLYTAYAVVKLEPADWLSGLELLRKYAISERCKSIVAYTKLQYMANLAKSIGGEAEHILASFPV